MQLVRHYASQLCSYAQPCTVPLCHYAAFTHFASQLCTMHYVPMQHVCHYASQPCSYAQPCTVHYATMQHVCHYISPTCCDLRCWHFTSLSLIHQPSRGEVETKDNVPLFFLWNPNPLFCYTSLQLFCLYYRTTNSSVCLLALPLFVDTSNHHNC